MPMISVILTPPLDVMQAIDDELSRVPALMGRSFRRGMVGVAQRALERLKETPGTPHYPLRWKSERQRRAFFATNGFGGGIPSVRSGALEQGWQYALEAADAGGDFTLYNSVDYAVYVQGDFAQPYHLDTGWPQAAPILADAREEAENVAIELWYTVSDIYAGARG